MAVRVVAWAKENPGKAVLIVGAAGVALWFIFRGTSSGSASGGGAVTASRPSDAEVQAGTQISLATLSAQAQAGQQQFQLAYLQQQQGGTYALTQLQSETQAVMHANELTYRQTVDLANLETNEGIARATLDAQTAWANISAGQQIATQQIAAAQSIQLAQIQSETNLGIAHISGDVQKSLASYQKDVAIAQAQYQAQATIAGYNADVRKTGIGSIGGIMNGIANIASIFF